MRQHTRIQEMAFLRLFTYALNIRVSVATWAPRNYQIPLSRARRLSTSQVGYGRALAGAARDALTGSLPPPPTAAPGAGLLPPPRTVLTVQTPRAASRPGLF